MHLFLSLLLAQTGVDAGPAQVSCDGSTVTLAATPINPPVNYLIEWEGAPAPGVFLTVNPTATTTYRVSLTDLDTNQVYEDTARVLVHPLTSDLFPDGMYNGQDWLVYFAAWGAPPGQPELDPDNDGSVTVLDAFYFCNFDVLPPNTPPRCTFNDTFTFSNQEVDIEYDIDDDEQTPVLQIVSQPANGTALLFEDRLIFSPNPDFVGTDSFEVNCTDGFLTTPNETVVVEVLEPDTWTDLYNDIFFVSCKACHIDAVSGGLSLSTHALAQAGGVSGAGFIAGFPELSPIYLRVADASMPLGLPPLSSIEIERIRQWIINGALPKPPPRRSATGNP